MEQENDVADVDLNWDVRMRSTGPHTSTVSIRTDIYAPTLLRVFDLEWEPIDLRLRHWHILVEETLDGVHAATMYDIVFRTLPPGVDGNHGMVRPADLAWLAFLNAYVAGNLPVRVNAVRRNLSLPHPM